MHTVLFGIPYFLIVTPLALVSRLFRDPLSRRRKRRATTYWTPPTDRWNQPEH